MMIRISQFIDDSLNLCCMRIFRLQLLDSKKPVTNSSMQGQDSNSVVCEKNIIVNLQNAHNMPDLFPIPLNYTIMYTILCIIGAATVNLFQESCSEDHIMLSNDTGCCNRSKILCFDKILERLKNCP